MSAQEHPLTRVESLINIFSEWLKHRQDLSEARRMDTTQFDKIASDLRVSPGELDTLVQRGPHAADELPRLLKVLGIDEAALARTEPLVLRDMERVCALCASKRQCDRDLAAGSSAEHYEGYCLNAPTIDSLDPTLKQ